MPQTVFIINILTDKSVHVLLNCCLSYEVRDQLGKRTIMDGRHLTKGRDNGDNVRTALLTTYTPFLRCQY